MAGTWKPPEKKKSGRIWRQHCECVLYQRLLFEESWQAFEKRSEHWFISYSLGCRIHWLFKRDKPPLSGCYFLPSVLANLLILTLVHCFFKSLFTSSKKQWTPFPFWLFPRATSAETEEGVCSPHYCRSFFQMCVSTRTRVTNLWAWNAVWTPPPAALPLHQGHILCFSYDRTISHFCIRAGAKLL